MAQIELVLCMIVKDEENQIFKTINSCKDVMKTFYILDTGSTDKTKEIITNFCKENDIKLILQSSPFIDFSTNRNEILFYIYENSSATHILFLDSNDVLYGGKELIQYLSKNPDYDGYFVTQKWEDDNNVVIKYRNFRCIKNNKTWKYVGVVHEVIVLENANNITVDNPDIYIYQNRVEDNRKSNKRYKRDAELLLKEYAKNPNDTRSLYYLANTFYFMEEHKLARKYYKLRTKFDTYDEEKYQSMIRYAKSSFFLKDDWSKVEKWLWKAWNFYRDLEPILILARHYYDKQYHDTAYYLTKMCCDFVYTRENILHVDETMYEFKRWYLGSLIANYKQDHEFGYEATLNALKSQYCRGNEREEMETNLEYYKQALLSSKANKNTISLKYTDKQLVLLFGGFSYYKWNGNSIRGPKGLGGSETSAVYIAENLVKLGYSVVMCCDTETYETINGVEYIKVADYEHFISTYVIDILIVLRYADFIRYTDNIKSVYLWLQDVTFIGSGFIDNEKLKGIVTLCNWHKLDFYQKCTMQAYNRSSYFQKITSIGNAIITDRFENNKNIKKIKSRFIYSSCPSRALEYLIDIWDDILGILPDATLSIFSDFDNSYVKSRISNIDSFISKIKSKKGVQIIGRVNQEKLALEMSQSEFWLYTPFEFDETYCITALEMQAAGVTCICTKNGSLTEVVGERGILLSSMDKKACKKEILSILKANSFPDTLIGREWSKTQSWENRAREWVKLFNESDTRKVRDLKEIKKVIAFYVTKQFSEEYEQSEYEVNIYNYAHYNEVILNNASIIFTNSKDVYHRFKNRFSVLEIISEFDLSKRLKEYFVTHFYNLKSGENDGFIVNSVVNINHCYKTCNDTHKHGDVYLPKSKEFVPSIIEENPNEDNLRAKLSIPETALVFGVYECITNYFIYEVMKFILKKKTDVYFIFYNFKPLINHPRIIHVKNENFVESINTCNALIIYKQLEIVILNFVIRKKPVITFNQNEYSTYWYKDSKSLETILEIFRDLIKDTSLVVHNYNLVKEFYNPKTVMEKFNTHFLIENKSVVSVKNGLETKVKVCGHWMSSEEWCRIWNKMSKDGKGKWNNISFHSDIEDPDCYLIVNKPPPNEKYVINKSIVLRMEPNQQDESWYTDKRSFLYFLEKSNYRNTGEWHLSKSYSELRNEKIETKTKSNILSVIMSSEYRLDGHKLRINFLKFLQDKKGLEIDVYGKDNKFEFKNYKGPLPLHCKDLGLIPYKYTFMGENALEKNFFTEKIIDPILTETLIFYWGCPNISDYIDDRAYILLNPNDFEESYNIIIESIKNNEWEKRVDFIRKEKLKIINHYTVFPRIEALLGVLNIKNIVINIKEKKDRLELFEKRRLVAEVKSYDIFEALVGKDIDFNSVKSLFNFAPSKGEIGCAMSHYTIWKNIKQDTVVFEDDVEFYDGYIDSLSYLYQYLKINDIQFDLIFLGYTLNNSLIERMNIDLVEKMKDRDNKLIFPFEEFKKYRTGDEPYSYFGGGTFGYLISEQGAKNLVSYTEKYGFKSAIDYHIYNSNVDANLKIYGLLKPIVHSELATNDNQVDSSTFERN